MNIALLKEVIVRFNVILKFEVLCYLDFFRIAYYKLIADSPTRFDLDKWHGEQAFPQVHNSSRNCIAFRFSDLFLF